MTILKCFSRRLKWPVLLALFFSVYSAGAQNKYELKAQFKLGMTGIEKRTSLINAQGEGKLFNSTVPGVNVALGVENHFILTEKRTLSISAGCLLSYGTFKRKQKVVAHFSAGDLVESRVEKISSYAVLLPLKINTHLGRFSCSMGWTVAFRNNPRADGVSQFEENAYGISTEPNKYSFIPGIEVANMFFSEEVTLKRKMDAYWTMTVGYRLFENLDLSVEYSRPHQENILSWEVSDNLLIPQKIVTTSNELALIVTFDL